uniref:Uncharacterized protein n=1 Tax=Anguilla anguilla TaxID=7936 RepID=A0A0E9PPN2_ANGAN
MPTWTGTTATCSTTLRIRTSCTSPQDRKIRGTCQPISTAARWRTST